MHLQQRFSTNTLHASFHTVVGTFRGRVIDHTLLLGEACGLSFHPILRRPDHAIVHISKIGRPLTLCEAAHLTATLVANNSPIAYTPLLSSHNRNLQLIGLNLVYRFGFIDAEHLVNHLVVSNEPTISDLAIHTLCAICGAVAEAYYGIPCELEDKALSYLPEDLLSIYYAFQTVKRKRVKP